jgi:hypothetical protein
MRDRPPVRGAERPSSLPLPIQVRARACLALGISPTMSIPIHDLRALPDCCRLRACVGAARPAHDSPQSPDSPAAFLESRRGHVCDRGNEPAGHGRQVRPVLASNHCADRRQKTGISPAKAERQSIHRHDAVRGGRADLRRTDNEPPACKHSAAGSEVGIPTTELENELGRSVIPAHIRRMTSVNRTIEQFTCAKCGLGYRCTKEPFPYVRAGRFDCINCNTEVHAWSGNYDFTGWKGSYD